LGKEYRAKLGELRQTYTEEFQKVTEYTRYADNTEMLSFGLMNRGTTLRRDNPITGTWDSLTHPAFKFAAVTENTLDTKIYLSTLLNLISRKTYDSMSAAQKKVIDDHCTPEWSQKVYKPWYDDQVEREDEIRKAGDKITKITKITPAEFAQWRSAAEPVVAAWKASVAKAGLNADEFLNEYKAELKKSDALF
jgi:hypothetical protein